MAALLDIRTLIFVITIFYIVNIFGSLASTSVYRWSPVRVRLSISGSVVAAGSTVLLGLRGVISPFLSIVVANTLSAFAFVLFYQALRVLCDQRIAWRVPLLAVGGVFCSFLYFGVIAPDERLRIIIASVGAAAVLFLSGRVLIDYKRTSSARIAGYMASGYILCGAIQLLRALDAAGGTAASPHLLEQSLVQMAAFLGLLLMALMATLGFTLLTSEQISAELERLAALDPLTEVYNRRTLDHIIPQAIAQARRFEEPLAVALLDVDRFKLINDTYGHLVGDQVLQGIVATLQQTVRTEDTIGRFGGEEFIIVLPRADVHAAQEVAERVCHTIAQTPIVVDGHTLTVTISIGVAVLSAVEDDAASLIQRADQALYAAKAAGRDRVVVAGQARPLVVKTNAVLSSEHGV